MSLLGPAVWLGTLVPVATVTTPGAPGGACLTAVSLTPASSSGDAQVFEARYGNCEGAAAFRVVQLWVGDQVDPAVPHVNLGHEAGRMFIEGGGDCAPQEPVVLTSTWGSIDCAASSIAFAGDQAIVQWALRFDTATFAGVHGVYFDAKGGTGDPEPRLGWTMMGTYEVVAAGADGSTTADDDGTSAATAEAGDGSTMTPDTDAEGSATGATSSDDGSFPGGPANRPPGGDVGCACATDGRDGPPRWSWVLVLGMRRRRAWPLD